MPKLFTRSSFTQVAKMKDCGVTNIKRVYPLGQEISSQPANQIMIYIVCNVAKLASWWNKVKANSVENGNGSSSGEHECTQQI